MKNIWILCLAMSFTLAAFSEITFAIPLQSVPLKQAPTEAEITDLPELVVRIKPSVVMILTYDALGKPAGQGSGFFIAEDSVITNYHVVKGATSAEIKLNSGATIDVAGLLAFDESHDLALLKVDLSPEQDAAKIKPLRMAAKMPREGERIAVIGSPLGLEHTVSEGIVSAIRELPGFGNIIQMTAAISPGSSGSPVLNMRGEVIAVARSVVIDAQSLNFAVAIEHVAAMKAGKLRHLSDLDDITSGNSEDAEEEFARGIAAFVAIKFEIAVIHFSKVLESNPNHERALYNLGFIYFLQAKYKDTVVHCTRLIQLNPEFEMAHHFLGRAYGELGQYQEAIEAYKQGIHTVPDNALTHYYLGRVYGKLGRVQEEIDTYKQAIRLKPDYEEAHMYLGATYSNLGKPEEAKAAFMQVIRINPDMSKAHFNLGVIYGQLHRWKEAIDSYKVAIRLKPDYVIAHFNLGVVYVIEYDNGSALDEYKILKTLDEDKANELFNLIYN